jgi:anti-sigma regulatory factor (Ser/Thr protein kinase)
MGTEPLAGDCDGELDQSSPAAVVAIALDREPEATARARGFVVAQLTETATDAIVHDATLVASELVTNALLHGEGRVELSLRTDRDRLRIEVMDEGSGAVVEKRERRAGMTSGWGLLIVDQLSERWGASEGTTRVWAELPLTQ